MHRKMAILLAVIQMLMFLPSCALRKPVAETIPVVTQNVVSLDEEDEAAYGAAPVIIIVKNETIAGRVLHIDAQVKLPNLSDIASIRLGADPEKQNALVFDWIQSKAPETQEVRHPYQTDWIIDKGDEIQEFLSIQNDNRVYYLNVENDINGNPVEENEHLAWVPHYITEHRPPGLAMAATDAAKEASTILSQYSCFSYFPWNIIALDADAGHSSGAYYIELQPFYEDFPIFDQYRADSDIQTQSGKIDAWMSADGLFSFQGILLLEEIERREIERALSLDGAVQKMVEDFPIYAIGRNVHVTGICAAYLLQGSTNDATCTLIPGWAFECVDSAEKSLYECYYTCFYDFETGKLHLLKYN